jgi:hypothetical protein
VSIAGESSDADGAIDDLTQDWPNHVGNLSATAIALAEARRPALFPMPASSFLMARSGSKLPRCGSPIPLADGENCFPHGSGGYELANDGLEVISYRRRSVLPNSQPSPSATATAVRGDCS